MHSVLAVDDSGSIRGLVSHVLGDAGYEVVLAEDGQEALDYAADNSVDVVLTDINMPRVNGIELIQKLRGMSHYKFTPMLVLTTESSQEMKMKGREVGATGWLVKPFDPDQLIAVIKKVLPQ